MSPSVLATPSPSVLECRWTPSWMDCQRVTFMSAAAMLCPEDNLLQLVSPSSGPTFFPHSSTVFFSPVTLSGHLPRFESAMAVTHCEEKHLRLNSTPWANTMLLDLQSYVLSTRETTGPCFLPLCFTHRCPQVSHLDGFLTNELSDSCK